MPHAKREGWTSPVSCCLVLSNIFYLAFSFFHIKMEGILKRGEQIIDQEIVLCLETWLIGIDLWPTL